MKKEKKTHTQGKRRKGEYQILLYYCVALGTSFESIKGYSHTAVYIHSPFNLFQYGS